MRARERCFSVSDRTIFRMVDSYTFAIDVVQTIGDRLATKTAEIGHLSETNTSFVEWLVWEAFLACKLRQASYPFCEVAATPTYASEGVVDAGSATRNTGDLRVGGPEEGANHCWAFIEFALLGDANHAKEETACQLNAAVERLKRLGWKKSAALLLVLAVSQGDLLANWAEALVACGVWNQPTLTAPLVIALPNGGTAVLKAFDCKRDPTHILTVGSGQ